MNSRSTITEITREASKLIDKGALSDASSLYEDICRSDPGNPEAWMVLGSLYGELGNIQGALKSLNTSLRISPNNAEANLIIGKVLAFSNNNQEACKHLLIAVNNDPGLSEAYELLGSIFLLSKENSKASEFLEKAIAIGGDNPVTHYRLGTSLLQQDRLSDALCNFQMAAKLKPDYFEAYTNIAYIHRKNKATSLAIENYRLALTHAPDNPLILHNYGLALQDAGDISAAIEQHRAAIRFNRHSDEAHHGLGCAYFSGGNYNSAVEAFKVALGINPHYKEAYLGLANTLAELGRHEEALVELDRALNLDPDFSPAHTAMAASLMSLAKPDAALEFINCSLRINPDNNNAIALKINILTRTKKSPEAYQLLAPFLEKDTLPANMCLAFSSIARDLNKEHEAIQALEARLDSNAALTSGLSRKVHFALGNLYDTIGRHKKAFQHYTSGNELNTAIFDPWLHAAMENRISEVYATDFVQSMPHSDHQLDGPIFIVGMPRSGSSLVEQILATHPRILGAGELPDIAYLIDSLENYAGSNKHYPDCIPLLNKDRLNTMVQRYLDGVPAFGETEDLFTDKLPSNFSHLGLIQQLFPNARIIHCKRNPLDTCLSCYFQDFSRSHTYTYSLKNLGTYYKTYEKAMDHWKSTLDLPVLDVQYEDLVISIEAETRRLLEFCGVAWDEDCLQFFKNKRYVGTASYDQVNKPLYTQSVERWKHYEEFLSPLKQALGIQ